MCAEMIGNDNNLTLKITTHIRLEEAVCGADYILCQVRIGGMEGRAHDERIALDVGMPSDEGIGPGGLACYLRSRQKMRALIGRICRFAPGAIFLQMSSPLGLNVALAREEFGSRAFGLCELPIVTARSVIQYLKRRTQRHHIHHHYAGLNHQSWLYAFREESGADITAEVLSAIDDSDLVGVDPEEIRRQGAIPVPYLRLYLHTARVLAEQKMQKQTRGEVLVEWCRVVNNAFCDGEGPDVPVLTKLLSERKMNWFEEAVIPVLEALSHSEPKRFPLNVTAGSSLKHVAPQAIVEIECDIVSNRIQPVCAPDLPVGPAALMNQLVDYERAVLELPTNSSRSQIASVLAIHPMMPHQKIAQLSEILSDYIKAGQYEDSFGL
jgi:6-phospho-beta-glucosidase